MKIICIGRNYADHVKELKNDMPSQPLVFMKPPSALLLNRKHFYIPDFSNNVHFETEIVLKLGKNGRHVQPEFALDYIDKVTIGFDFTARDIQDELRAKGHSWEIAKGFDHSAVVGDLLTRDELPDLKELEFYLEKNGTKVQHGFSKDMMFSFTDIICHVSKYFRLQMGDYIFTGTPAGVGPVTIGDKLRGYIHTKEGVKEILSCDVK